MSEIDMDWKPTDLTKLTQAELARVLQLLLDKSNYKCFHNMKNGRIIYQLAYTGD